MEVTIYKQEIIHTRAIIIHSKKDKSKKITASSKPQKYNPTGRKSAGQASKVHNWNSPKQAKQKGKGLSNLAKVHSEQQQQDYEK